MCCVLCCGQSLQSCSTFATLWTGACQAPLSMRFSRQEYWCGLLWPPPGYLPDPGIEPISLHCRQVFYPLIHLGNPTYVHMSTNMNRISKKKKWFISEKKMKWFNLWKSHWISGIRAGSHRMKLLQGKALQEDEIIHFIIFREKKCPYCLQSHKTKWWVIQQLFLFTYSMRHCLE